MKNYKFLLAILGITLLISCNKNSNCVSGSGSNTTKNYSVNTFNALAISGDADVFITKDSIRTLRIEGQSNVLNVLNVSENGTTLSIGKDNCFKNMNRLKIYVSTPTLTRINTSGSFNVFSNNTFKESSFSVDISGTGNMDLNLDVQEFNINISGDGNVKATGNATNQFYTTSGTGYIQCFNLNGENADINVSGTADVEVNVSKTLDVEISGSGSVYYKGTPSITTDISGSGILIKVN